MSRMKSETLNKLCIQKLLEGYEAIRIKQEEILELREIISQKESSIESLHLQLEDIYQDYSLWEFRNVVIEKIKQGLEVGVLTVFNMHSSQLLKKKSLELSSHCMNMATGYIRKFMDKDSKPTEGGV